MSAPERRADDLSPEGHFLDALDRAARYYREALTSIVEECKNDRPQIILILEAAERGLRAADHELES